ncbi:TPA: hypothetical protein VBW74_000141 [Streptococcus agalactiae]|nr:hypothetical protein [Streptococcus agalactiae]
MDLVLSSQTDLTNYVKKVSIEDFGCQFLHTAHWNNRLRTTGGRFFPNDRHLRRRRVNLRKFACGYCHGRLIESF